MREADVYEGWMEVNGTVLRSVRVFFSPDSAAVFSSSQHSITLHPFPPSLLHIQGGGSTPFSVSVESNRAGTLSRGPHGHPGDGEFDSWPVTQFRVDAQYSARCLKVKLCGSTATGRETVRGAVEGVTILPAGRFSVEFVVDRPDLPYFLKLPNDKWVANLEQALNQISLK